MLFFEGKGYNEEFTKHMASVIEKINENDMIQLVCEVDIVCEKCPNNVNLVCTSNDKVTQYDKEVLKYCNLSPNDVIMLGDYKQLLHQRILFQDKLNLICGNCEWSNICQLKSKNKQTYTEG
jgi:hypothetical protein